MYAAYNVFGRQEEDLVLLVSHISKEDDVKESRRFLLEVLGSFETME